MSIMLLDGPSPRRADSLQDETASTLPGLRQIGCRRAVPVVLFLWALTTFMHPR